ncbi:MAG TPA: hypothetical protein VGR91_18320 [Stellaceae bacterium]|nr:hypothetical protein [Stellaceae bacterium]
MMRLGTIFWLLLVATTGFLTFAVKYEVQGLDDAYAHTKKAIATEASQIRVLKAEWAYLNRPAALAALSQRFLALAPIATTQLVAGVGEVPMRPDPPPPPAVAAAAPPNPPQAAPQRPNSLGELIAQVAGR